MSKKSLLLAIFIAFLFVGCGNKIELADFSKAPILKSSYLPSNSELEGKKTNILIIQFNENNIHLAQKSALGNSMAAAVDGELAKAGSVSVVKRVENSIDMKKELEASELSKELNIDTGAAEYLITGKISSATFSREYIPPKTYKDKKKRVRVIPAKNVYQACSRGTLQIFELPSMVNVKSISLNACASRTEEATSRYNYKREDLGLVRSSGINAVRYVSKELKAFFSLKGYILERRTNSSNDRILLTTLGSSLGAVESEDVDIFTIKEIKNPINNKIIKQPMKIGEGVISNQISTNSSWIIVKKVSKGETIKIGDYIKITYRGFFD